jgi:hypothetical protein
MCHLHLAKVNMKMKKAKRTVKRDKNEYEASTRLIEATDSIQSLIHTLSTYDYDGRSDKQVVT